MAKKKYTKKDKRIALGILLILIILFIIGILTNDSTLENPQKKKSEIEMSDTLIAQQIFDSVDYYINAQKLIRARGFLDRLDSSNVFFSLVPKYLEKIDSIEKAINIAKVEERIQKINDEIDQISKFDNSLYRGSIYNLEAEVVVFKLYAEKINELLNSENVDLIKLGGKYRNKVLYLQTKEFPKMRKEYAKIAKNKLWENDINVSISGGSRYTTLNFTGGIFAANKNIGDFQAELKDMLKMLHFKRTTYRWYKGQNDYTYYTIISMKDNELIE